MISRIPLSLELSAVLAITALIYGFGIMSDRPALGLISVAAAWGVAGLALRLRGQSWKAVGLNRPGAWRQTWIISLAGAGLLYGLVRLLKEPLTRLTGRPLDISLFEALRGDPVALLGGLLVVWCIAAFGEEMVFRGYMLNRIAQVLRGSKPGWTAAVGISSLIFGLGHIYQGPTGMILSGMAGLVYCGAYLMDGRRLWAPVLIHGLYDTGAFLILYLNLDRSFLVIL
jgi:membrane protease YdiL (CAAX protease family)